MKTAPRPFGWAGVAAALFTAVCTASWVPVSLEAQAGVREAYAELPE